MQFVFVSFASLFFRKKRLFESLFCLIDVHPDSVCEKLGPKYASVPVEELENRSDFFEDLLRYT